MVIYKGTARLVFGERQEDVAVTLQITQSASPPDKTTDTPETSPWAGRILSNCDWAFWSGKLITIALPSGANSQAVVERSGIVTGFGHPPFGS
ncbi:MAG: hypothetical protein ABI658_26895 [Acidimicrobiales bacterium]